MAKKARVYDGSQWIDLASSVTDLSSYQLQSQAGLRLIKTQAVGTGVSSVTVTDAFSSTYDAYKIVYTGGVGAGGTTIAMGLELNPPGGGNGGNFYAYYLQYSSWAAATGAAASQGNVYAPNVGYINPNGIDFSLDVIQPFNSNLWTFIKGGTWTYSAGMGMCNAVHLATVGFTGFRLVPGAGTITGGTIRVYGYNNGV